MRKRTWSDEQLTDAVAQSFSLLSCLKKLGLHTSGGNYRSIRLHIERLKLDSSHWTGQSQSGDRNGARKCAYPLKDILVKNSTYTCIHRLKIRLAQKRLLENICAICGMSAEWAGAPLVMILDHINGDNRDHRLENLRFVCPNCGSQLPTFAGRNKNRKGP